MNRCPDCGVPFPPALTPSVCPACGLPLVGAEAVELVALSQELESVAARRATLLQRRAVLVAVLRARRRPGAAPQPPVPVSPPQAEAPPSAQSVLLTAGGLLILLAGLVFTLVSWGRFGIGGRAAVLGALTCAVLAAPVPLRRRQLDATAETASAVGLGLVLLDAYAARAAGLAGLDGHGAAGYWAWVTALAAVGAAAYGRATHSRVLPYTALLLAQCPALLTAAARHVHLTGLAYALLADAALNFAVAARTRVPYAAEFAGAWALAGGAAALLAGGRADAYGPALSACGPLVLAAALTLTWAFLAPSGSAGYAAALGGLALVGAVEVLAHQALPAAWAPLGWAGPGALLAGAALCFERQPLVRRGLLAAGVLVLGLTGVRELPPLGRAFISPLLHDTWRVDGAVPAVVGLCAAVAAGAALRFRRVDVACGAAVAGLAAAESAALALSWPYPAPIALAGALAAGAAVRLALRPAAPWAYALLAAGGTALCWSLPRDAAALTVWAAAALLACGLAAAGRFATPAGAFAVCALAVEAIRASAAAGWPPHVAAYPVLAVAAATVPAAAWLRTHSPAVGPTTPPYAAHATAAQPAYPAGESAPGHAPTAQPPHPAAESTPPGDPAPQPPHPAGRSAPAPGLIPSPRRPAEDSSLPGAPSDLDVPRPHPAQGPAPDAAPAPRPPHPAAPPRPTAPPAPAPHPPVPALSRAVELAGYLTALLALALSAPGADTLVLVLALSGAAAGGVALRADRRRHGAVAAAALVTASTWVRLGLAGVHAPEPYTVSVSCLLLALGWVRRRRQPEVSSFAAYGAGLVATLGPSLVAAWADTHWVRPLLLGVAALAVTLLGAHHRLRAPLLTGGVVLVADAAHELAPTVVQSLGHLPRWVPVAVAGALLVYVGATYERRRVAAHRIRRSYQALR